MKIRIRIGKERIGFANELAFEGSGDSRGIHLRRRLGRMKT
jgi:hypothetical protein